LNRGIRRTAFAALASLALAAVSACGSTAGPQTPAPKPSATPARSAPAKPATPASAARKLPTVIVAVPSHDPDFGPLDFGQAKGFFQKRGVSVSVEAMATPAELAALLGNSVQFIGIGAVAVQAAWKGAPVRLVAGMDVHPAQVVVARPGIKSPADLRGRAVATNGTNDILAQMLAHVLQQKFGVPARGVTYVGYGPDVKKIAALEAGAVSAAVVDAGPGQQSVAAGMHQLLALGDYLNMPVGSVSTTLGFMKAHPDRVRAVVRGVVEAMRYMHAHPQEAIAFYESHFGLKAPEAKATFAVEDKSYGQSPGYVSPAAVRTVLLLGREFASASGQRAKPIPAQLSPQEVKRILDLSFLPASSKGGSGG
jgi:NitT/TauT family transport system substrate-binding protein